MSKRHFSQVVIGAGLIGSAAARHLSQTGEQVAIIGPAEPAVLTDHTGVFASHYDQGRLTHLIGKDIVWAHLAKYAITNYEKIEAQSKIDFYSPVGLIVVSKPDKTNNYLRAPLETAEEIGAHYKLYSVGDRSWKNLFPYLDYPAEFPLLHEDEPAGYINPRALVEAQLTCAQQQGATLIRDTVIGIDEQASHLVIQTASGETYTADQILVASGASSNFNNLLPRPIPLKIKTETIILAEVSAETAVALNDMPTVIYQIEADQIDDIYMAPPIQYPDGRYYIKMGCNTAGDQWPTSLDEIQAWFHHGRSDDYLPAMREALQAQFPQTEFLDIHTHRCFVCYTPSGYPTIDQLTGRIFVAAGGNGSGAKGSDTLGRLAAGLLSGAEWLPDLPRDLFRIQKWHISPK